MIWFSSPAGIRTDHTDLVPFFPQGANQIHGRNGSAVIFFPQDIANDCNNHPVSVPLIQTKFVYRRNRQKNYTPNRIHVNTQSVKYGERSRRRTGGADHASGGCGTSDCRGTEKGTGSDGGQGCTGGIEMLMNGFGKDSNLAIFFKAVFL